MTTTIGGEVVDESDRLVQSMRLCLLALIGGDVCLLGARAASYQAFFLMPGARSYLIEPIVPLAVYAAVVFALPFIAARIPGVATVVRVSTVIGAVGGAIEVASTALESLWALPQHIVTVATVAAMLSLFLLFGVAGFVGGRRTRSFLLGLGTALGSAMFAILIVVTFGFLLVNTSLPTLAHDELGDPDYLRSGWTDVRAFAIANTYDAGLTHLVEAPVIAAVLGAVGSGMGRMRRPGAAPRQAV